MSIPGINQFRSSQVVPEEVQIGYQEESLHREGGQALEWAAQGSGGVPIPGETCGRDAQGRGLVMGLGRSS